MLCDSSIATIDRLVRSGRILIVVDLPDLDGCDTFELERIASDLDRMQGIVFIALTTSENQIPEGVLAATWPHTPMHRHETNTDFSQFIARGMADLNLDHVIHFGANSPVVEGHPDLDLFPEHGPIGLAIDPLSPDLQPQILIDSLVNALHYIASIRTVARLHP